MGRCNSLQIAERVLTMKTEDELPIPMSAICWCMGLSSSTGFKYQALDCYSVGQ